MQVSQANKLPSTPAVETGGTSYMDKLSVAVHNSQTEPLLSFKVSSKLIDYF